MSDDLFLRDILAGNAGWVGKLARPPLALAAIPYRVIIAVRNRHYDRHGPAVRVSAPVISVGNLTAGGTGKTPLVIELCRRLTAMGRTCAVVARGYGASPSDPGDEQQEIESSVAARYVADPDRARGAGTALRNGADVLILDDGFQHRRLHRDLDVVVIDATCPFGFGCLLPRGLLREPRTALRRAGLILLTRSDLVTEPTLVSLTDDLRKLAGRAPVLRSRHRVTRLETLDGLHLPDSLAGVRVVVVCGIGNPTAFVRTVQNLGAEVVDCRFHSDHHRFRPRDVSELLTPGRFPPHDLVVVTEKDAVKLRRLVAEGRNQLAVVKIAIDLDTQDDRILQSVLESVVRKG
jgi:tetraacyldisaccharide 4'-kinase